MNIRIKDIGSPSHSIPRTLLGDNIEINLGRAEGLLSDRLRNPKFVGPADPITGVAPQWQVGYSNYYYDAHLSLVQGISYSGEQSQWIANDGRKNNRGLMQTSIWLRKGEVLEVDLWARAQDKPAKLFIALRPNAMLRPLYGQTQILVDAGYWKNYRAQLTCPIDTDEAVFQCFVEGHGRVHIDQMHLRPVDEPTIRRDVRAMLKQYPPPAIRFPGGCESEVYRWRNGTDPVAQRPAVRDAVFKGITNYDFGTDEYLEMCADLGAVPHITVAVGNGTPDEAGEWAAYCAAWYAKRGQKPPLMYWHVGNEVYGRWELGSMPASQYARTLAAFTPLIRKAYPAARVIAIGVTKGNNDYDGYDVWRKTIVNEAAGFFDMLSIQYYPGWVNDETQGNFHLYRGARNLANEVRSAIADCDAAGLGAAIAVTEWGLWVEASSINNFRERSRTMHALYAAACLMDFTRLAPRLELAEHYHFGPVGLVQVEGRNVYLSDTGRMYELLRPAFGGQFVPVDYEAPMLVDDIPAADVIGAQTKEGRWVIAANRSADQPATLQISGIAEGTTLHGESLEAPLQAHKATIHSDTAELPPLSVTRLRLL